jgi:glycogen debranching enzyme
MAGKPFSKFSIQKDIIDAKAILVIDSLSQMTSSYIEYIRAKVNKDLEKNLMGLDLEKTETMDKFSDDEKFNYDQWNYLGNLCWEILKAIQAAPFEVIAITHPVMAKYEDGSTKITPSMGSDRFAVKVANHFDNVIYAEFKLGKYAYSSTPGLNGAIVGSRSGIDISKVDPKVAYSLLEPFHPTP